MTRIRSVCVYCGSSSQVARPFIEAARRLGHQLAEQGWQIVYGGGRVGLMGLVADAALEAGGRVLGIIPHHIQALEVEHTGLNELHVVDSMHTRKQMMFERSDAFVALPGGLGTLDETFEVITWRQLGLHDKPIIVVNVDAYWDPFLHLIDHLVASGFCRPEHRRLFQVVDRVEDVAQALSRAPEPTLSPRAKWI